jgi:hypothetical protein
MGSRDEELRLVLRRAAARDESVDLEPLVSSARAQLEDLSTAIGAERLHEVEQLCALVSDKDWIAPPSVAPRVAEALGHLISDCSDGELSDEATALTQILARDLQRELEGYAQFCEDRDGLSQKRFAAGETRERWLARRRRTLRARIQDRRSGWRAWFRV